MPLAGDIIYATDVTRARPRMLYDNASGALAGSVSAVPMTGISISVLTETAGAEITLWWTLGYSSSAASTAGVSGRPRITAPGGGTTDAPVFATAKTAVSGDNATPSNSWYTTLGAAGTYTITLLVTIATNDSLSVYTTLTAMVQEQFS